MVGRAEAARTLGDTSEGPGPDQWRRADESYDDGLSIRPLVNLAQII